MYSKYLKLLVKKLQNYRNERKSHNLNYILSIFLFFTSAGVVRGQTVGFNKKLYKGKVRLTIYDGKQERVD